MSSNLLWELTKNQNAFLVKRNGVVFSSDPANLSGRNLPSHSGFINKGAVSISLKKPSEKKTNLSHVTLSFSKRPRFLAKNLTAFKKAKGSPNVSFNREILNVSHGVHTASKVIKKRFAKRSGYVKLALKKLFLLHKASVTRKLKQVAEKKK